MKLADAGSIYVGSTPAAKVYAGSTLIWQAAADPSTDFWFDFDAGTDGNDVATSDTGSGTGWDFVGFPYPDYDAPGKDGSGLCAVVNGAGSYCQWDGTAQALARVGGWFKLAAAPASDARVMDLRETSSSGTVGGILVRSDRTIRMMVGSSGQAAHTSPALTLGSWYWLSLGVDLTSDQARLTVHDSLGASVYDSGLVAAAFAQSTLTTARFGAISVSIGSSQYDDVQFDQGSAAVLAPWGV